MAAAREEEHSTYQIELEGDPLTGDRHRESKGGFATYNAALTAAIEAKRRQETGQAAHAKRMRLKDYLEQWHGATATSLKPSAAQNDLDYINGYIVPVLGDRWLGDITVPVINAFYKHLAEAGRRKADTNTRMYEYWVAGKDERDGLGPNRREMAARFGVTLQGDRPPPAAIGAAESRAVGAPALHRRRFATSTA